MSRNRIVVGMLVCLFALVLAPGLHAVDITGTWVGTTEVPDQGTDQVTMVLKKAGDGYSGTIVDSLGQVAPGTELKNVTFGDDALSYSFSLTDGSVVTMKLKVNGLKMTGQWAHEEGATGTITFEKKSEKA